MTYTIHYNGAYEDSFNVSGDTLEEIRVTAISETERRGWASRNCWSEKVSD